MPHRPLSSWISTVDLADAPIVWGHHIPTNDGDERSDARGWPRFKNPAWRRVTVPVVVGGVPRDALGLRYGDTAETVVELDDASHPIPIGLAAFPIIDRVEEAWPSDVLSAADRETLAGESRTLRFSLVERLAAEGDPAPETFWLLPWKLLDRFCIVLGRALEGSEHEEPPPMRHWLNPLGCLIAPALEQIYAGLAAGDGQIFRLGATAFCARLLELDPDRAPQSSRDLLAAVALRLAAYDPLLRHTGRRAAARLTEGEQRDSGLRLSARLRSAAASSSDDSYGSTLEADPFRITATVRAGGRLTIVVEAALDDDEYDRAAERYAAIIVALTVTDGGVRTSYFVPIGRTISGYSGLLRTRISSPAADLTMDGPPIGAQEVLAMPADEVLPSLTELDLAGTRGWSPVAGAAPAGHPLKAAINDWRERHGL
jgi:hypothetical protein